MGVRTLLRDDAFQMAIIVAGVVVAVVLVLRRDPWWHGCAGLALPLGALAGIDERLHLPAMLVVGVIVLGFGEKLAARTILPIRAAFAVPGALLIAHSLPDVVPGWAMWVVALGVTFGAPRAVAVDRQFPRLTPMLLGISAFAVYVCVPETSATAAAALAGAGIPAAVLALVSRRTIRPSPGFTAASIGVIAWMSASGGYPRPGAVVGSLTGLGVLLVGWRPRGTLSSPDTRRQVQVAWLSVHVVLAVWASRVAGLRHDEWEALALVVPVFAAGAFVAWYSARPEVLRC